MLLPVHEHRGFRSAKYNSKVRLCRLMGGKASPYRSSSLMGPGGYASDYSEAEPLTFLRDSHGKAQPFPHIKRQSRKHVINQEPLCTNPASPDVRIDHVSCIIVRLVNHVLISRR
jgi:hypothetical protein